MNRAVLITGAGARVGKALAEALATDGWALAIHYYRSEDSAQSLADNINKGGGTAAIVKANLNVPAELDTLIARSASALGQPITALINNASTFAPDTINDFTRASYDHHMQVNLAAPLSLAQQFAAQDALRTGEGVIINMIDQRVLKPNPTYLTYTLSKSAMLWATKTLAQALAPNIRVNAIGPGPTLKNTRQSEADFDAEAAHTLLGTGSPPDTILQAARYLLAARAVTGQMIAVDGGQHLTWQTEDLIAGDT